MEYRREIDGLRALAVLPVILFHAGFDTFSGGFVGVDIFFVISGYLITTIILTELEQGKFSIVNFYERRARRILPTLFLVMFVCIPFAWLWLLPSDMKDFSQSLVAVSIFLSNVLFWDQSGYFDTAAELKPLLHTWSLAVEEQYYVLFPLLLIWCWKLGKRRILILLALVFIISLIIAQWAAYVKPTTAFYLLPTRCWELLIGAFAAFYLSKVNHKNFDKSFCEVGGSIGVALIIYAVFFYSKTTPFPGFYALVPTLGTVLVILCANQQNIIGKFLGNKVFVGIGLISYSAYLWHQPLFSFARHKNLSEPNHIVFIWLSLITLMLAYFSWRFVEAPFRSKDKFTRKSIFSLALLGSFFFISFGVLGNYTNGYKMRFDEIQLPNKWDPPIKCHGADAISNFKNPLNECLGANANGIPGDIFLLGDSHAAQLSFPLKNLANERKVKFNFLNTEDKRDFPYSFFESNLVGEDRIFKHILRVADRGDIVIISFHRGHLNESRDKHLPLIYEVKENEKYRFFVENMESQVKPLVAAGIKLVLVKDGPLLSDTSSIENCAYYNLKSKDRNNFCSVSLEQDLHTRTRQSKAFDFLSNKFQNSIIVLDPLPTLYGESNFYNPINLDGTYRMFDRHHLTESEALKLIDIFRSKLQ